MVCSVTIHALCATMVILIDAGIVIQAFIIWAGADDTTAILTKCIAGAFFITCAAVIWVIIELILWQTHWVCVRTTIDHIRIACIGTLSLIAATGFGVFQVRTGCTTGSAVIWVVTMNIDA